MTTLLKNFESLAEKCLEPTLKTMIEMRGMDATILRPNDTSVEVDVYGEHAGHIDGNMQEITTKVVYTAEGFTEYDDDNADTLDEVEIFCLIDLLPGDMIDITRYDGRLKRFKVLPVEGTGVTTKIATKYRCASTEDNI